MLWLAFAFVCVITSNSLQGGGHDGWLVATFVGTLTGLAGAAYCSLRGVLASDGWLSR
jgi:hypothetical protein